jgi:hypothetical protein
MSALSAVLDLPSRVAAATDQAQGAAVVAAFGVAGRMEGPAHVVMEVLERADAAAAPLYALSSPGWVLAARLRPFARARAARDGAGDLAIAATVAVVEPAAAAIGRVRSLRSQPGKEGSDGGARAA